jgi:hypothetical protein
MATNNAINANSTTPLPIVDGGTQVTSVTTAPAATAFAGWDANKNLAANNMISGYATTVSSASPIVLTVASAQLQYITGSTAQTVTMPVTSTLASIASNITQSYTIVNLSSNTTTVNSSGGNLIVSLPTNTQSIITCISNSGTTAASWSSDFSLSVAGVASITGTANQVIASASTGAVTLSLPQSIATTSDVTFDSLTFSVTTKGIVGTTTNNNATTGYVGELITSNVASGTPVTFSTGVVKDLTSISLTAGDWDVWGNIYLTAAAITAGRVWLSTSSASAPDSSYQAYIIPLAASSVLGMVAPSIRVSAAGSVTAYISASATGSATFSGSGNIFARRAR